MTIIPIQPFTRVTMNSAKSTQTRFTIAKKIEVLDLVKNGKARTEICREFSLASSTLFQFIKDEKKIRDEFEKNRNSKRTMIKNSPFHELEQALIQGVSHQLP